MDGEFVINSSRSFIIWNDFESSSSSTNCPDSPLCISPPVCQSTPGPQSNRSFQRAINSSDCSWHADCESPLAKRKKLSNPDSTIDFIDIDIGTELDLSSLSSTQFTPTDSQCLTQQSSTSQLLGLNCCELRCLATLSLLEIEKCRKNFQSRTNMEQQQFLLDTISLTATKSGRSLQHNLTLAGKQLCRGAFLRALDISEKRMRKITNLYLQGVTISPPTLTLKKAKSVKHSTALAWMERYFNRIGDKMPHLQQIHLPHFLSRKMVYELMVQDLMDEGICKQEIISSSHFYAVWREEFRNCIIPKVCIIT